MLVLTRKKNQQITIGDRIRIMVIEIRGDKVRLSIDAAKHIPLHRQKIYNALMQQPAEKEQESPRAGAAYSAICTT
jgi:carbon storage regulator